MIESALLIAFGFCVATLLALIVLPFVTRRAARLAAERLQDMLPLSADEIAAERDGLRATAAVEQRRLEQRLDDARGTVATRDTELGRRAAELASLQETREADAAARAALTADLDRTQAGLADVEAQRLELQRRNDELSAKLQEAERQGRAISAKRDELEALADERRGTIAGLETRCAGLEMRRGDLEGAVARGRGDLDRVRAALADMTRDRDLSRTEVQLIATQRTILQDDLTELTRRAETHRLRFEAKAEALERAEQKLVTEKADRLAAQASLADLRRRFERLEARLIEHGGRGAEGGGEGELTALRTAITGVADQALALLGPRAAQTAEAAKADPGSNLGRPTP